MLSMGWIAPPQSGAIEGEISQLNAFTAGAMKVHTQPFPLPYQQLMAFGLLIFTLLIPVPFILDWRWYIGVPTAVATTFLFGIEYLARKLSVCESPQRWHFLSMLAHHCALLLAPVSV